MEHLHPKVSFITVNFNQPEVTEELLDSLSSLNYPNWEVVVVDNGSDRRLSEQAVTAYGSAKYLLLEQNRGFAAGNNAGIALADGQYFFFVNNDTEVPPDCLEPMLEIFRNWPDAGIVSPKILYHGNGRIQYAGSTMLNSLTIRNRSLGWMEVDRGQFDEIRPTGYAHGAAMMVSREVLEKVGTMEESYFLYYEELDWTARIRRAGYGVYYCGLAKIFHKESVSTGTNSPLKVYYLTRNRLLFARRNFQGVRRLLAFAYFILVAGPKNFIQWLIKGRWDLARAVWRAIRWNLTHSAL